MSDLPAIETAGNGEPVVLLHGFGGSAGHWADVQQHLTGPSIAFDLPGHGSAIDWPRNGDGDQGTIATRDAIIAEFEKRGLAKLHLVGHSRGGAIAILVALKCADKIASLTLVAPGGCGPEIAAEALQAQAGARTREEITTALTSLYAPDAVPDDAIGQLVEQRNKPEANAALLALVPSLMRDGKQGMLDLSRLKNAAFPIDVFWGTSDAVLPVSQAENFRGLGTVELIEGAGHMLPEFHAEAIAAAVNHHSPKSWPTGVRTV